MKPLVDTLNKNTLALINVLVVDDDHDDTAIIKDTIEEVSSKHAVNCLHKSDKLFEYLDSIKTVELPSLIILDYNMPIMTGIALLKQLKSSTSYKHIPVAVYSNSTFSKHKEECTRAGACIYVSKASTVREIQQDLKEILSHCLQQGL